MGSERDARPPERARQHVHDHLGLLAGELVQRGKPGDSYVRIRRQNVGDFRRTRRGEFLKHLHLPIANHDEVRERSARIDSNSQSLHVLSRGAALDRSPGA